ncbi:MAG: PAS domain-containing protein [Burkholderiaceae bacterium]|nr:PAS domain-containing protein [Burkholderiaceae bacterium]
MDRTNHNETASASSKQALRRQAEELVRGKVTLSGVSAEPQLPEGVRQTLHDLQVHQIELEMQNEELRRTQMQLEAARARYFDLYDLAPVGYCTVSEQGVIQEANIAAATLLGVARSDLVGQKFSRFIAKTHQDHFYLNRKQLFASGEPQTCELQMVKRDGAHIWVQLTTTGAQDDAGAHVQRVVLMDITDTKLMAAAMQESEARYRALVEQRAKP